MKKGRLFQSPFSGGGLLPFLSQEDGSGQAFPPQAPPGPFPPPGAPPPGQFYQPAPQSGDSSSFLKIILGAGCGCLLLIGLATVGLFIWLATLPDSGAIPGSQLSAETIEYLTSNNLINEDEQVLYYYDATLNMDNTESCFFTNYKVAYYNNGMINEVLWEDVKDIQGKDEFNFVISVSSTDNKFIKCEIAPLNGGEQFYNALLSTWESFGEQDGE